VFVRYLRDMTVDKDDKGPMEDLCSSEQAFGSHDMIPRTSQRTLSLYLSSKIKP